MKHSTAALLYFGVGAAALGSSIYHFLGNGFYDALWILLGMIGLIMLKE